MFIHQIFSKTENIQSTLEQHQFELSRSPLYTNLFDSKYYSTTDLRLVEISVQNRDGEEPQIQRSEWKLYVDFQLGRGLAPLTPRDVQEFSWTLESDMTFDFKLLLFSLLRNTDIKLYDYNAP